MDNSILLKDYLHIIKRHIGVFFSVILLSSLFGLGLTYLIPKTYTSTLDFYVSHRETTSPSFFTYEGYYATQASVQYASTVAGYLQSLSTLSNAASYVQDDQRYKDSNGKPESLTNIDYLANFQKNITVKINAPQIISLQIRTNNSGLSEAWASALGKQVMNHLNMLNATNGISFTISPLQNPITQTNALNPVVDLLLGLIIGSILGLIIVFTIDTIKK